MNNENSINSEKSKNQSFLGLITECKLTIKEICKKDYKDERKVKENNNSLNCFNNGSNLISDYHENLNFDEIQKIYNFDYSIFNFEENVISNLYIKPNKIDFIKVKNTDELLNEKMYSDEYYDNKEECNSKINDMDFFTQ